MSIAAAAFLSSAMTIDKSLEAGRQAPKIEVTDGTNVVTDANPEEKIKLISFWSPKKPASRIANRNLNERYGGDKEDNIEFISICTDADEALMNEVMKIDGINPDRKFSYSDISSRTFKDYNAEENPRAYKISAEGKILEII